MMPEIHSVAVFCGASHGNDPIFREAAEQLGRGLAAEGLRLIYGGGHVGLMGTVADSAVTAGGTVVGVIPDFLRRREVAHEGIAELIVTDSMHGRKRRMFEMADVFVTLPGGLGTLDETFEILTWRQLKLHDKPILICDIAGSAAPLLAMIEAAIAAGFARPDIRGLYEVTVGVAELMERLKRLATAKGAATALL
ncbi:LOG family protein [Limobrevibacterium gyesilva]|uniref:Cytokinin riboside 5'-monophosphate phosphoribohydrolase n=1 Tax=Limobrevibacterium gyesilva TaxID=2991712 RepID=A0AA41YQM9_9PROT|nr:TIGR00730 family Rossman fold protein [Limobrevibacterium gyesilva]MCW3476503.1 TIGR00730 family Rossman fold protein [Limobrevibacterium gyesilva]